MKKVFLLSLLLLTGCGYLPSTNPNATESTTLNSGTTKSTAKSSKDAYEIRYEGKKGMKGTGVYTIYLPKGGGVRVEEKKGVLPFSVKFEAPSGVMVSADLNTFEDNLTTKVFISRNGEDCGKGATGSAIANPERSKTCPPIYKLDSNQ